MAPKNRMANENDLPEQLEDVIDKIKEAVAAIAKLHKQTAPAMTWYVLKHEGIHHLVPNYGIEAYCGWKVVPEADMVPPPPESELEEIADAMCPGCKRAAITIDSFAKQKGLNQ